MTSRPPARPLSLPNRRATPSRWPSVALALVLVLALGSLGVFFLARSRTFQLFGRIVARVDAADRVAALTIDGGPDLKVAERVLGVCSSRHVRATFFVTGRELVQLPGLAQSMVATGHELGNHSYSDEELIFVPASFIRSEVETTDDLIRKAGQRGEIYFRPPYGLKLLGLSLFLSRTHRTTVMWDVDPESSGKSAATAQGMADYVEARTRPGSIIVMRAWHNSTALEALPKVIDAVHGKGYEFITVGELLEGRRPGRQEGTTQ